MSRPVAADGPARGAMGDGNLPRLVPLGPDHGDAILAGQDEDLAREIIGAPWTPGSLAAFLERCAGWRRQGPLREWAALDARAGILLGGGGLARLGPGLERGEAALSYWVLAAHRGRGLGVAIARTLVERAREDPRIDSLVLRIAPDNAPSRAVARRLGAHSTGREEPHPAGGTRRAERWGLVLRP